MARILALTTAQQLLLTLTNADPGTVHYAPQDDGCTIVPVDETHTILIAGDTPCVSQVLMTAEVYGRKYRSCCLSRCMENMRRCWH